jgi:hypothetical protein
MGASDFISPQKDGVLLIFITLENPLSWLDLNLQTLGPMPSTLTITPLMQLCQELLDTLKITL